MKYVTAFKNRLLVTPTPQTPNAGSFTTGLTELDALLPGGSLARGAVHELIPFNNCPLLFVATLFARGVITHRAQPSAIQDQPMPDLHHVDITSPSITMPVSPSLTPDLMYHTHSKDDGNDTSPSTDPSADSFRIPSTAEASMADDKKQKYIVYFDPGHTLHPPGLAGLGVPLDRVLIVRPTTDADLLWSLAECLKCQAVGAVVGAPPRLSRVDARKLQLAAEQGQSVGIFLRASRNTTYAAATRWLVSPAPGLRLVQRWTLQLIHGHADRPDQSVQLEHHRETQQLQAHRLHSSSQLARRPSSTRTG